MRITNRMLTDNSLRNISVNKKHLEIFGDQYATGNKIQKPSDDPTIAVRHLKYTTQLTHIDQYLGKNIQDAYNWMGLTETSITNMSKVLGEKMSSYCNEGANGTWNVDDRDKIVDTLNEYKEDILDELNTDYAGRYIFSGYRTDTAITLSKKDISKLESMDTMYTITEKASFNDVNIKSYVYGGANYAAGSTADDYAKTHAELKKTNILQLGYRGIDSTTADKENGADNGRKTGVLGFTMTDKAGNQIEVTDAGTKVTMKDGVTTYTYDATGALAGSTGDTATFPSPVTNGFVLKEKKMAGEAVQGDSYTAEANEIVYIPETGEMVLGSDAFVQAQLSPNFSIQYTKSDFKERDINPIQYYDCEKSFVDNTGALKEINYSRPEGQEVQYEISFSQKLTVNTMGLNCITPDIITKIDELIEAVNAAYTMKERVKETEKLISNLDTTAADYQDKLDALNELKDSLNEELRLKENTILQEVCGNCITVAKEEQSLLSKALANTGSRYNRLELTDDRLTTTKLDVTTLQTKNFKVDMEDAIINFEQANVTYNASLSCTSKVIKQSLLDYL